MAVHKAHLCCFSAWLLNTQAYRTILTHFSQRYPRMPTGLVDCSSEQQQAQGGEQHSPHAVLGAAPAMVAFDGMLVPLSVLPALPLVGPVVARVLARQEEAQQQILQLQQASRAGWL